MTNVKNKKNNMTAPKNPNSKADANVIRVPNKTTNNGMSVNCCSKI